MYIHANSNPKVLLSTTLLNGSMKTFFFLTLAQKKHSKSKSLSGEITLEPDTGVKRVLQEQVVY